MISTDEIMHDGKTLTEIIRLHKCWKNGEDGGVRADLSGADLRFADLSGADLRFADLSGADLSGSDLRGADLSGAYLNGADLSGAYLNGAYLSGADLRGAYLRGADLRGSDLRGSDLSSAYLSGADLRGSDLSSADLSGADLSGAYLSGADFNGADLRGAYLSGAEKIEIKKIITIGPMGSRSDYLTVYYTDNKPVIKAGCFFGDIDLFRKKVADTHKDNAQCFIEYNIAITAIEAWDAQLKQQSTNEQHG